MRALFISLLLIPVAAVPSLAQSPRSRSMRGVATDAVTAIRDVSDKAQDFWNVARQQRAATSVDTYMNMAAFAGEALALNDIASNYGDRDTRYGNDNDNDMRTGARRLVDLAKQIDRDLTGRSPVLDNWRQVQQNLLRLSDAYNLAYDAPGLNRRQSRGYGQQQGGTYQQGSGTFRWRGRVDGSDHIMVRGTQVWVKHLQNNPVRDSSFDLPQPLPARNVDLRLAKLRGRGKIEIVNQPAQWNNYTATILVEDSQGGDDYYEFELTWQ